MKMTQATIFEKINANERKELSCPDKLHNQM
jgi:hypothetical protein